MKETVFEKYTISKDTIIVEGNEKDSIRIENNLIEQNYFLLFYKNSHISYNYNFIGTYWNLHNNIP